MALAADNYGRPVRSMRVQVNTTCNFRCFFCHMEGTGIHSEYLSAEEIEKVIETAARWGVNKIKFTGGEPTIRKDIVDIVRRTRKHISGNISMTTNGIMLPKIARDLKAAGLDRVNISLHSIEKEKFEFITGVDGIEEVVKGIRAAHEAGLSPIKVNFVVLKNLNESQIPLMIRLSAEENVILQLIEFETTREMENSGEFQKYHVSLEHIEKDISAKSFRSEFNDLHHRPKYHLMIGGKEAEVEFVKPMRNSHFCDNCTRIRLTSTGMLKPCLMRSDNYRNIISGIRNGVRNEDLDGIFLASVKDREPYWKKEDELENNSEIFWVSEG
ncbi:MAG: GTP 3',8-cyclase MoaA [Candidatus Thermoplasmatota archaeon]|nr:GTP 3',8-cyclase MoaA [Candidatus Thermoplasmatota archaeon]